MLEKLITDLKKSLPEPLRKKLGVEPSSEETEDAEVNEEEEISEEESVSSDTEDKKKKQKSMIIRVIVVLALGYLAYDQFLAQPPEPSTEELLAAASKPRKRKKPPVNKVAEAPKTADVATDVKNPPVNVQADASVEKPVPAEEPLANKSQPEVVDSPPVTSPEPKIDAGTQPPVEEIHIADKKSEEPTVGEVPPQNEVKGGEEHIEKSLDGLIDGMDKKEKKELNLADKIVVDDVYTPPPAYDQLGRGLVYNCKEKYWSCVDKSSYVSCNKNMKWNKSHGKQVECSIINVYSNDDDCNRVQKYNVSTNQSTAFCQ